MQSAIKQWLEKCVEESEKRVIEDDNCNLRQAINNATWLTIRLICSDLLKLFKED